MYDFAPRSHEVEEAQPAECHSLSSLSQVSSAEGIRQQACTAGVYKNITKALSVETPLLARIGLLAKILATCH